MNWLEQPNTQDIQEKKTKAKTRNKTLLIQQ